MLITRKNLNGGRHLKSFPLVEQEGIMGYQIGYCACGCNERLIMKKLDAQEILAHLFYSQKEYKKLLDNLTPRISFKGKVAKWLIKQIEEPVYNKN